MKNKTTAGLLSLFLGVWGVQFFYLGRTGLGMFMLFMTLFGSFKLPFALGGFIPLTIPILIGIIKAISLFTMDQNEFNKKYNTKWWKDEQNRRNQGYPPQNQQYPPQYPPKQQQYPPKQQYPPRYEPATPNTGSLASQERAKIEALRQEGLKKQADYDFKGAIEAFGKGIDIDGKDNLLHWQLACCYSEEENTNLALYHLEKAIQNGFKDFEKIKKEDTLAFLRIQPEFEPFVKNNYKRVETIENQGLLDRLKHLASLRERGMLSEKDFAEQSKRLFE